jgi:Flp pilus assembly protein TadB
VSCPRCGTADELTRTGWCKPCEAAYDAWVRQHATDIILPVLGAMVIVVFGAMALPFLGMSSLVAAASVFVGFGTLGTSWRLLQRRRRRQYLATSLPRAYLPEKV